MLLFFVQCKKSLLTETPTIPQVTIENYYKTEKEIVTAVNAVYTPLSAIYSGAAWHLGDIMSDDADLGGGGGGDGAETAELDNFSMSSFNPIIQIMCPSSPLFTAWCLLKTIVQLGHAHLKKCYMNAGQRGLNADR